MSAALKSSARPGAMVKLFREFLLVHPHGGQLSGSQKDELALDLARLVLGEAAPVAPAQAPLDPSLDPGFIRVDVFALAQLLQALAGPEHMIRELQATRSLHKLGHPNPIETLLDQVNAWGAAGGQKVEPLVMNPDLEEILGRPNFSCAHAAVALRAGGQQIAHKAESEQAAVILFLLNHYRADAKNWWINACDALQAMAKGGAV